MEFTASAKLAWGATTIYISATACNKVEFIVDVMALLKKFINSVQKLSVIGQKPQEPGGAPNVAMLSKTTITDKLDSKQSSRM